MIGVALGWVLVTIAAHVGLCRKYAGASTKTKFLILLVLAVLGFGGYVAAAWVRAGGRGPEGVGGLPLSCGVLYVLLTAVYFVFFGNAPLESPTQVILRALQSSGGLGRLELEESITDERFIRSRLDSLERNGFIVRTSKGLEVTPKGRRLARVLRGYERLLGRKIGG